MPFNDDCIDFIDEGRHVPLEFDQQEHHGRVAGGRKGTSGGDAQHVPRPMTSVTGKKRL